MFKWKSEQGVEIVNYINDLRASGMRGWGKIADRVNERFEIKFHKDKVRKGWRSYGDANAVVDGVSAQFTVTYNTGEASSRGSTIKTLEDLVKACEIDLKIWKIDRHTINKWEVKPRDKSVHPLFQVKSWLSKIIPDEQRFPVVQPISMKASSIKRKNELEKK